jgi:hypothetical protein
MVDHNIGSYCFRNKIINGDMRIDQRNAGAAAALASGVFTYTVDRWAIGTSGSTGTSQRITDPTTGLYSLRVTGAAGNTSISFNQRIESQNSLELVNRVVNLSFDMFASTNTSVEWQISYPTIQDNFTNWTVLGTGTINATTSRTTFNTGPVTLDNNVNKGLLVRFVVLNHTAGKTVDLTNVQLEVGPTATPFEYRPIGTELALCQRYYSEPRVGMACASQANTITMPFTYPTSMRTVPTLSTANVTNSFFATSINTTAVTMAVGGGGGTNGGGGTLCSLNAEL